MNRRYLLPRNSLLWLVAAQGLSIAPLFWYLPVWLPLVWLAVMGWRLQEFRGRWPMPGRWTRVLMLAVCVAGLILSFRRLLGLEPMVTLLVCALLLKQLEMQQRRDALLLVYLNFFLIGVQFLFSQTLLAAIYGGLCLWLALTSMLALNQPTGHQYPWRSLRLAGRLALHTLPLMILLFLLMPRLGTLWAVPNPGQVAKSGVSDSMAPGDITRLTRAGGVAFRVAFEGPRPAQSQLYWRGLVFSEFDGRRWSQSRSFVYGGGPSIHWQEEPAPAWRVEGQGLGEPFSYSIILEPSHQNWLYSLTLPVSFEPEPEFGLVRDFRLVHREPVHQRLHYRVTSNLDYRLDADKLPGWLRERNLKLPADTNPRSLQQARQWRAEVDSDEAYIQRLLAYYRESFVYTLEPPALGDNSVDEFMWQTQSGFCEHFASSFAVMMRAAGVPARVVAGYQGGEYNELEDYLVVHQYDAHAWTEVWLDGQGWVRVDPTGAVAPERVQQSLGDLQSAAVEGVASLGRYRQFPLIAHLRLRWDAINYRWYRAVVSFDRDAQSNLLERLLGGVSPVKLLMTLLVGGGLLLLLVSGHLWWQARPRPRTAAERAMARYQRLLQRRGWERHPGEPVGRFAARVAAAQPAIAGPVMQLAELFEQDQYRQQPVAPQQWRQSLSRLRRALNRRRR